MKNNKKYKSNTGYIFNVSLSGFDKIIKRKIFVNDAITIDSFCRKVIVAMNGDLSHGYGVKINREYLSEEYENAELSDLNLKEKQRMTIIYDWGDNWIFNLMVSKIIDNYSEEESILISGKGFGIIDDCGGPWALEDIFNNDTDMFGKYDINDFDLEKCKKLVKETN